MKTGALTGAALDWAVAKCEGLLCFGWSIHGYFTVHDSEGRNRCFEPSANWAQGGPIIEREEIGVRRNAPCSKGQEWEAMPSITSKGAGGRWCYGPTPLIAAMRCYVASRLGDEVDIPEELL